MNESRPSGLGWLLRAAFPTLGTPIPLSSSLCWFYGTSTKQQFSCKSHSSSSLMKWSRIQEIQCPILLPHWNFWKEVPITEVIFWERYSFISRKFSLAEIANTKTFQFFRKFEEALRGKWLELPRVHHPHINGVKSPTQKHFSSLEVEKISSSTSYQSCLWWSLIEYY